MSNMRWLKTCSRPERSERTPRGGVPVGDLVRRKCFCSHKNCMPRAISIKQTWKTFLFDSALQQTKYFHAAPLLSLMA